MDYEKDELLISEAGKVGHMFPKLRGRTSGKHTSRRGGSGNFDRILESMPLAGGILGCQVFGSDERPLAGASVTVFDWVERRVASAETDPYGYFFATVPRGNYRLVITADGYLSTRLSREIWKGDRTPVEAVQLEPDSGNELPQAGRWEIDPAHSGVRFMAQHIGMSRVHGRFDSFRGYIEIADALADSYAEVVIDAASINTNNSMRDDHLRSPDFLDVERFPYLHFQSSRFSRVGGSRWAIDGELTIHGMTRSVRLDTRYLGVRVWDGSTRVGCTASAELHREHFTLNWQQMVAQGIAVVGSTIDISLDVQAVLQGQDG